MAADVPLTRLIELLHTGTPGDAEFYQRLSAGVGSVLEVGCGWGRLLAPLVETGAEVWAVEVDDALRAQAEGRVAAWPPAKQARVRVLAADMRTLDLGRRFDRVLVPYCGLYCLGDRATVVATLQRLAAHLTPDGVLAFDGYDIGDPEAIEGGLGAFEHLCTLTDDGATIEVYELDEHEPARHRCRVSYRFEVSRDEAPTQTAAHAIDHHYLVAEEVTDLLDEAGLTLLGRWGSFEGDPIDDESEHLVFVAGLADAEGVV